MIDAEWDFSTDTSMGTHMFTLAVNAADGLPFTALDQESFADEFVDTSTSFDWSHTFTPPQMTAGMLVVHAVVDMQRAFGPGHLITATYGGVDVPLFGAQLQITENFVGEIFGVLMLGDHSDFDGELVIHFSGVAQNISVTVGIQVLFFEGIDQASDVTAPLEAGDMDTFASPLSVDPAPSATFDIVFTAAAVARLSGSVDVTASTSVDGYVEADDDASSTDGVANFAWFGCDVSYNCECETDPEAKTLEELRIETLMLTGYAMQASNPPPGVALQYNAYLRTAQGYLIKKYRALETERFFSWTLRPGIRYYGLRDNRNCCDVKLDKYRITGAWLQDLNNVWWPLIYGIDPTFYTLNVNFGWPAFYEVRQCVEIFPAPQAAYTLWIKGHFELLPFTDDADVTTINAEVVKNWAVFLAKAAKGAADATVYSKMATEQIGQLISGAHVSKRYIPGTSEIPVPTPPVMVHFDA